MIYYLIWLISTWFVQKGKAFFSFATFKFLC